MYNNYENMRYVLTGAILSKDPSTKVGVGLFDDNACILSTWNSMLSLDNNDRYTIRELKYKYILHAEQALIANCAYNHICAYDKRIYCTVPPCSDCAKLLIASGISEVIIDENLPVPENWRESIELGYSMFEEAHVRVNIFKSKQKYNLVVRVGGTNYYV